jgi:LPXTG-motif cell wall-anchored protein
VIFERFVCPEVSTPGVGPANISHAPLPARFENATPGCDAWRSHSMTRFVTVLVLWTALALVTACASSTQEEPEPAPAPTAVAPPPAPEPEPEPAPAAPAPVVERAPALPETASQTPAVALTGLAALAGAGILTVVRRRL